MRSQITPDKRIKHANALATCDELMLITVLDGLEGCLHAWGTGASFRKELSKVVLDLLERKGFQFAERRFGFSDAVEKCVNLTNIEPDKIRQYILRSVARHIEEMSEDGLYYLSGVLAQSSIKTEQSLDALKYALDRIELAILPNDGDGDWRRELEPPRNLNSAIAQFLYTLLGAPEADFRWRAVHMVLRLCWFGKVDIIQKLIDQISTQCLPAFTDQRLPFYGKHAQLYLLIALNRAAQDDAAMLSDHAEKFANLAFKTPHVLIRHFAATLAIAISSSNPACIQDITLADLKKINLPIRPVIISSAIQEPFIAQSPQICREFRFAYNIDRRLEELAQAFKVGDETVNTFGLKYISPSESVSWRNDPRDTLMRRSFKNYHDECFRRDDFQQYLSFHAMMGAASDLLLNYPIVIEYDQNKWIRWFEEYQLTRPDGRWLSDRRDLEPIGLRNWQRVPNITAGWVEDISDNDFENILSQPSAPNLVNVWSWRSFGEGSNNETIGVTSAFISKSKFDMFLSNSRLARHSLYGKMPTEGEHVEIDTTEYCLKGWIIDSSLDTGIDEYDPFRGSVRWPVPRPGRRIRRLAKLKPNRDMRTWRVENDEVIHSDVWGAKDGDPNCGKRLLISIDFLKMVLLKSNCELLVEVHIRRTINKDRYRDQNQMQNERTKFFLFKQDGSLDCFNLELSARGS